MWSRAFRGTESSLTRRTAGLLVAMALIGSACGVDEIGHTDDELAGATAIDAPVGPPPGHIEEPLPTTLTCEDQVVQMAAIDPDRMGASTPEEAVSLTADAYGKHHPLPPTGFTTWDEYAETSGAALADRYLITAHESDEPVAILSVWDGGERGFFVTEWLMCAQFHEEPQDGAAETPTASHTIETQWGSITVACSEAEIEMYMFAPALGNGAPDPITASDVALSSPPVSVDTAGLAFAEREFGVVAWFDDGDEDGSGPDQTVIAWVEPARLSDGTWGAGAVAFCASRLG